MHLLNILVLFLAVIVSARSEAVTCFSAMTGGFATPGHTPKYHKLGEAWRTAKWRNGRPLARYNQVEALKRVTTDADLNAMADRWLRLNQGATQDQDQFLNFTYRLLVLSGDLRNKFNSEPIGISDFLDQLLSAREQGVAIPQILPLLGVFLDKYVKTEAGFKSERWQPALVFFHQYLQQPLRHFIIR